MPTPDRRTLAGLGAVAAAVLVVTWVLASRGIAGWEPPIGRAVYDLPDTTRPWLRAAMQLGSRLAPLAVGGLLVLAGWRWRAVAVTASGWLAWGLARAGKALVDRPRPTAHALGRALRDQAAGAGYPSSHAAIAFGVAVAVVVLGRPRARVGVTVLVLAVATALARVHLAVHWPLDVLGGAAAGTLAAVVVGAIVAGASRAEEAARPLGPGELDTDLVVATFNIRNGRVFDGWNSWPFRRLRTVATAQDLGADILAVQEAYGFQARALSLGLPAYRRVGRGRNRRGGGESCSLYVRAERLEVLASATRWYGDHPEHPGSRLAGARFPRVATTATLRDQATGQEIDVTNTHLDARSAANRAASVRQLVAWIRPAAPTVVVGDLNATRHDEPELFAVLDGAGLLDAVPRTEGGTAHDYRGGIDHRRIDHIFVSAHWHVVAARVVADGRTRRFPSDHWPVLARLRLGDGSG